MNWLIIGITGVTCSGKSTLARSIVSEICANKLTLPQHITIGTVKLVKQDDYFHPKTSAEHIWIPEFNCINREVLTALNMNKMCENLDEILSSLHQPDQKKEECSVLNILVIEGFLIFNCKRISELCQIEIDLQLSYEECFNRRKNRIYNPPNPPGYFEKIIWPFYQKHRHEYEHSQGMHVMNGEMSEEVILSQVLQYIADYVTEK